jgi:hypothetical protein
MKARMNASQAIFEENVSKSSLMAPPMKSAILDRHIRGALVNYLRLSDPSAAIFHEVPLGRGERRADVVSVNGHIAGFEIKSERDSLARLKGQAVRYDSVCEYSTIVVAPKHLKQVREMIPSAWGILVTDGDATVALNRVRTARPNRNLDKWSLIRLMWKSECVGALRRRNRSIRADLPVIAYWEALNLLPMSFVIGEVRTALKKRQIAEICSATNAR